MRLNPTPRRRFARGFTLTELLVVIVIIAVLSSLGFAVAKRGQIKARTMQCLTQMRAWGEVMTVANMDLGGGRMYCPDTFASIGPNESPFTMYWAESVGLDGTPDRNSKRVQDQYDYDAEYKELIVPKQAENRSCPTHDAGANDYGNPASSYTINTYLQAPGKDAYGYKILRTRTVPRASKKIYMMDCEANGSQSMRAIGRDLVKQVKEVEKFHGDRVNAIFVDMHIEQLNGLQLENKWDELTQRE